MQPSVERRADPPVRMAYDAVVELRHADFAIPFQAGATNLGRHGIALEAPYLPQVGAFLDCRFPLPGSDELVGVTGEVVWTSAKDQEKGRFGLRFADLSDDVAAALEEAFPAAPANDVDAAGVPVDEDPENVRLLLEGVSTPVVARAVHRADDAIVVEQPLPFLSLGRRVAIAGETRGARLDAVDLVQGGDLPRLVLTLAWEGAPASPPVVPDAPFEADTAMLSLADGDVQVVDADAAGDDPALAGDTLRDLPMPREGSDLPALATEPPRRRHRLPRAGAETLQERPDAPGHEARPPSVGPRRLVRQDGGDTTLEEPPALPAAGWLGALRAAGDVSGLAGRLRRSARGALPPVIRAGRSVARLERKVRRTVLGAVGVRPGAPEPVDEHAVPRNERVTVPVDLSGETQGPRGPLRLVLVAASAFAVAAAVFALLDGRPGSADDAAPPPTLLGADPGTGVEHPYAPIDEVSLGSPGEPAPSAPETVPTDSPYAVDLDALDGSGAVPGVPETFGAAHVPGGQSFLLRMSQPVRSLEGREEEDGFSVTMRGTLAKDRAGPIAAAHDLVERAMILNRGSYSVLTVRFVEGHRPAYRVVARNASLEVIIGR